MMNFEGLNERKSKRAAEILEYIDQREVFGPNDYDYGYDADLVNLLISSGLIRRESPTSNRYIITEKGYRFMGNEL